MNKTVRFANLLAAPLLKGDDSTCFIYEMEDVKLLEWEIIELNSLQNVSQKVNYLIDRGSELTLKEISNEIFYYNLKMVDGKMPQLLADMILYGFKTEIFNLNILATKMERLNPLHYDDRYNVQFYIYKIKELLRHLALGMNSQELWMGEKNIYDHYPVIKKDNELIYYGDDINKFCELLLSSARIIIRSISNEFENINNSKEKICLKLNLEILIELNN